METIQADLKELRGRATYTFQGERSVSQYKGFLRDYKACVRKSKQAKYNQRKLGEGIKRTSWGDGEYIRRYKTGLNSVGEERILAFTKVKWKING